VWGNQLRNHLGNCNSDSDALYISQRVAIASAFAASMRLFVLGICFQRCFTFLLSRINRRDQHVGLLTTCLPYFSNFIRYASLCGFLLHGVPIQFQGEFTILSLKREKSSLSQFSNSMSIYIPVAVQVLYLYCTCTCTQNLKLKT
jgi:hypothetical protein